MPATHEILSAVPMRTLACLLLAWCCAGSATAQQSLEGFAQSSLVVETAGGARHSFTVYLARDKAQRARGLSFVESLPADHGMLFVYDSPRHITMWMRNTFIPLDMLFIDASGKVVRIANDTVPHSLEYVRSGGPASAVLELNAGIARKLGIREGDRVLHSRFADGAQGAVR